MKKYLLILILIVASFLRLYNLDIYPQGLNADEAAIGYNAYSLLKTGRDEYGVRFPLVFKSFGDYKPGLYFYFVMPFVAVFGLNEWAVRLPSALLAIAIVYVIYLLGKKIFNVNIGLIAAALLTISPWHLQFSRGGWESNSATFFITLGVYLLIIGMEKQKFIFWSQLSFLISMYLYQSPRLIVPVFLSLLFLKFKEPILKFKKQLFRTAVILLILSIPLILQFTSGAASARFSGLSFLADPGPASRVNELRGRYISPGSLIPILFHNKITAYGPVFLGHLLDHFSSQFLFIRGDGLIRNLPPDVGQFFIFESIFLLVGLVALIRFRNKYSSIIFTWILVSPLAGALTFQTPNSLRSLVMVVPLTLVIAFGIWHAYQMLANRGKIVLVAVLVAVSFFEFTRYIESYYVRYPKRYPIAWEYGFKEMVVKLNKYESSYKKVVITDRFDQPYILVLFFKKYDPLKYQPQAYLSERDKFNFGTVRGFDKYKFTSIDPNEFYKEPNVLYIGTRKEIPESAKIIDEVVFPDGNPGFIFAGT